MPEGSAFPLGSWVIVIGGLVVCLAACASDPAPEAELATAAVAIDDAEEANAPAQASGPYELARDKLERAREAMEEGEMLQARRLGNRRMPAQSWPKPRRARKSPGKTRRN